MTCSDKPTDATINQASHLRRDEGNREHFYNHHSREVIGSTSLGGVKEAILQPADAG